MLQTVLQPWPLPIKSYLYINFIELNRLYTTQLTVVILQQEFVICTQQDGNSPIQVICT